uniref:Uncharacterized protein n=1 Tax=Arundo donax TaxID=35708 RepID=A0A0A9G841_ARUDO
MCKWWICRCRWQDRVCWPMTRSSWSLIRLASSHGNYASLRSGSGPTASSQHLVICRITEVVG